MKVLYIVTAYDRHAGDGITPWLVETIHRLRDEDVEVEVLAPSYRGLASGAVDGVMVHRYRYAPRAVEDLTHDQTAPDRVRERPLYLGLVPPYVLAGSLAARRIATAGGFDLVHAHWPLPHALLGSAARRAAGVPLVLSFHGVELTFARRSPIPLLSAFLRRAIRTADAVTANSTYTARLIRALHDRPVEILPFGSTVPVQNEGEGEGQDDQERPVDGGADHEGAIDGGGERAGAAPPPRSPPPPAAPPPASPAAPPPAPPRPLRRLLFVGRLVERKGVRVLLEALAGVRETADVRLDVVGQGPEREALTRRARELGLGEDAVVFHGFVPDRELARHYREADAFVLPAVHDAKGDVEGLGVVLIEALAHGLPVIASDAGGIPDIVQDGRTGVLVPPGDAAALRAALLRLHADPRAARALGEAGRRHVRTRFSWEAIIPRLAGLYRRVLAERTAA